MNPALDFLLKKKGPLGLVPFLRVLKSSGELGARVGVESARFDMSRGKNHGVDYYSPEIQKYESSALGSTRII